MGVTRCIGVLLAICWCWSCGSERTGESTANPDAGKADPYAKLIAAFTTSACKRLIECQSPSVDKCKPYTEPQMRQAVGGLTWSAAEIDRCTVARTNVLSCLDKAACPDIDSAAACSTEKSTLLDACAALLTALGP